jgi:16S rRNA (guanine966-N2)-methyltransferase
MAALGPYLTGSRVLDLFAGSGALGLEALSRGAETVTFVERNRKALGVLKANIERLGAGDECTVIPGDALAYIRRIQPGDFDLVVADPPYEYGHAEALLKLFTEKGFAGQLWVEHRSSEDISPFPGLRQRRYGDTTLSSLSRTE